MKKLIRSTIGLLIAALLLAAPGCESVEAAAAKVTGTVPAQTASYKDGTVNCYFPRAGQDAQAGLIQVIESAQKTLDMAIYSFTDGDVADAVAACAERGVTVRILSDKTQSGNGYQKKILRRLKKENIPVKVDAHSGIMHLKITIADGKIATTGSYNYTKSADQENDEVFVVFHDEKIARNFEQEFENLWNDGSRFETFG